MVVVLPEPLTPTTRMTNGLRASTTSGFATGASIFSTSAASTALISSGLMPSVVAAFAQGRGDPPRGRDAEIGADQHILDLLDGGGIELALGHEVRERRADRGRGALEPAGQPLPPAPAARRLGLG